MYHPISVTFSDVAAYFSEDEWKALDDRQKEVYRTVMKEIHGALISMGYTIVHPDILLRIKTDEKPHFWDPQKLEGRGQVVTSSAAAHIQVHPDILLRVKHEDVPPFMEDHASGARKNMPNPIADFPVITSVLSLNIKQEEEIEKVLVDPDPGGREGIKPATPRKEPINGSKEKALPMKPREDVLLYPDRRNKCRQEAEWKKQLINTSVPSLQRSSTRVRMPSNLPRPISLPGALLADKPVLHTNCEKSLRQTTCPNKYQMTHTSDGAYTHSKYEKRLIQNTDPQLHQRPFNSGERFYTCMECGRTFNLKSNMVRHQKIHTGERPFICLQCGNMFTLKSNLLRHQKTHTGERPFICTECGKSFSRKSHLMGHQLIHKEERPFLCTECGKAFRYSHSLRLHHRVHSGETLLTYTM